ncbi:hypothetical protein ACJX0J_025380, partial [Zea mays]
QRIMFKHNNKDTFIFILSSFNTLATITKIFSILALVDALPSDLMMDFMKIEASLMIGEPEDIHHGIINYLYLKTLEACDWHIFHVLHNIAHFTFPCTFQLANGWTRGYGSSNQYKACAFVLMRYYNSTTFSTYSLDISDGTLDTKL